MIPRSRCRRRCRSPRVIGDLQPYSAGRPDRPCGGGQVASIGRTGSPGSTSTDPGEQSPECRSSPVTWTDVGCRTLAVVVVGDPELQRRPLHPGATSRRRQAVIDTVGSSASAGAAGTRPGHQPPAPPPHRPAAPGLVGALSRPPPSGRTSPAAEVSGRSGDEYTVGHYALSGPSARPRAAGQSRATGSYRPDVSPAHNKSESVTDASGRAGRAATNPTRPVLRDAVASAAGRVGAACAGPIGGGAGSTVRRDSVRRRSHGTPGARRRMWSRPIR